MRICVIGAGSIGGLLAVHLAQTGQDVSVIARGPHLAAIKTNGLKLIAADGTETISKIAAYQDIAAAGEQDLVILGMKAHQVSAVVRELPSLYHNETMVLTAQNGIPWWYFMGLGGTWDGRRLESVDPGSVTADNLPITRVIGSVVYPAAEIAGPGVIRHIEGNRFSLAETSNEKTPRIEAVAKVFSEAGFRSPVVSDIRSEIWTKLWGNLSFNPISALTHATLAQICMFPETRALAEDMMREAQAIGEALGIRFRISLEKRIAGAQAVGEHKTSMLQDVEAGRAIELTALVGSVIELGAITGVPCPAIKSVYACAKLLAHVMQEHNGAARIVAV
jgi:2-dehydropantoate 2-reductase